MALRGSSEGEIRSSTTRVEEQVGAMTAYYRAPARMPRWLGPRLSLMFFLDIGVHGCLRPAVVVHLTRSARLCAARGGAGVSDVAARDADRARDRGERRRSVCCRRCAAAVVVSVARALSLLVFTQAQASPVLVSVFPGRSSRRRRAACSTSRSLFTCVTTRTASSLTRVRDARLDRRVRPARIRLFARLRRGRRAARAHAACSSSGRPRARGLSSTR